MHFLEIIVLTLSTMEGIIVMDAFSMSITGYTMIGTGIVLFIITQVLLNRWLKAYEAEQRGNGYDG